MESFVHVQQQVRNNAEEMRRAVEDVDEWREEMLRADRSTRASARSLPPVRGSASSPLTYRSEGTPSPHPLGTAADHTYDKGYRRWEQFDVEKALADNRSKNVSRWPSLRIRVKCL